MEKSTERMAKQIAEQMTQEALLPGETQQWVKALREENLFKFRKLLKKERSKLPDKYKRLYLADDSKLEIALHYLRTIYPFFTKEEKNRSKGFLHLKELESQGIDPLQKIH